MLMKSFCLLFVFFLPACRCQQPTPPSPLTDSSVYIDPTYIILAPRIVRPNDLFTLSAHVLREEYLTLTIKAVVSRDGVEITSAEGLVIPPIPSLLSMKIPPYAISGNYILEVKGMLNNSEQDVVFFEKRPLLFQQKSISVIVQLNQPVFHLDQTVRFRCIPVQPDLKGYFGTMDIFVVDPNNYVMRRWENIFTTLGVVSLAFKLNDNCLNGDWKIRIKINNYITEKLFVVHEYYQPKFEVNVSMPYYIHTDDKGIGGVVVANYTTGRGIEGRGKLLISVKNKDDKYPPDRLDFPRIERFIERFDGVLGFYVTMDELKRIAQTDMNGMEIVVEARIEEPFFHEVFNGTAIATVLNRAIRVKILGGGPRTFKPGMLFDVYAVAMWEDNTPITDIANKRIRISGGPSGVVDLTLQEDGIVLYRIIVPKEAQTLSITAALVDRSGNILSSTDKIDAYRAYSPSNSFIQVTTSTRQPKVGDFMILNVESTNSVDMLTYQIVAGGRVVFMDVLPMRARQKTFDIGLTRSMAPSGHIVVFYIRHDGEIVADALNFHVGDMMQNKINVTVNRRKDLTGDTVEVLAFVDPLSYVGFSAVDESIHRRHGGTAILPLDVLDELYTYDLHSNTSFSHTFNSDLDSRSHRLFFPSQGFAIDASTTMTYSGLTVMTDAQLTRLPHNCNITRGELECLTTGCYKKEKFCDGQRDCSDGSDETGCPEVNPIKIRAMADRYSRIERIYQLSWLWHDEYALADGRVQFRAEVPKVIANYVVTAIAMSRSVGLGIPLALTRYQGTRQFYIQVEAPEACRLGEQIGVRVDVFNFQGIRIEALIVLHPSDQYRFVNIEDRGRVSSFGPRLTGGFHEVLIFVPAGTSERIHIPVVALAPGDVTVVIEGFTGVSRDRVEFTMTVRPEGVMNQYMTPVLIDLVNKAQQIAELQINVTENFVKPLQNWHFYVPGSGQCLIEVIGDMVGPMFIEPKLTAWNYIQKPFVAGEPCLYNFAADLYSLLYMRHFHLWDEEVLLSASEALNDELQRIVSYQLADGSMTDFGRMNGSSTWITATWAGLLHDAIIQEWEDYFFVDPYLLNRTVSWLIEHQNVTNGSWGEIYSNNYDRKFQSNYTPSWNGRGIELKNLSMTAHCLINLKKNEDIRGDAAMKVRESIDKARNYLELHFHNITDVFEMAIVTYALELTESARSAQAFVKLKSMRTEDQLSIYWSNRPVPPAKISWPNSNPRIEPKEYWDNEGYAVHATAYALLTYTSRNLLDEARPIMTWLQTQRNGRGGFSSTADSITAMQALFAYAKKRSDRIPYNFTIGFDITSMPWEKPMVQVDRTNMADQQVVSIERVYGRVTMTAKGTGQGLLIMRTLVNVEYEWEQIHERTRAFDMDLKFQFMPKYNFSHIEVTACMKWLRTDIAPRSGQATFEMELPTGYRTEDQHNKFLNAYIDGTRNLRDAENFAGRIGFYFDYLDAEPVCIKFNLDRYLPVANMSRYYEVKVYEAYEPYNGYIGMYKMMNLFELSICHVCGSYQCPYCPYYASSICLQSSVLLVLFTAVLAILHYGHLSSPTT